MRARGMSIREIARQTGHDRNTVRKYLRSGEPPRMKPRPLRSSKLEP
jgi:transposase